MKRTKNTISFLTEDLSFPPVEYANGDGLLAAGGDLSPERLIEAYRNGIFPWFNDDSLILWWSPDPRMVLFPNKLHISRSMRKVLRSGRFTFTMNTAFDRVIKQCANISRERQPGTWITSEMQKAYLKLYDNGIAKSYETWLGEELVGGIYGLDMGHVFCGESMYHTVSNASKYAFIRMVQDLNEKGYQLLDCQLHNPHLQSLGAEVISRKRYLDILKKAAF